MKCDVQQTSPDERHVGIKGHAVAKTPTVAAHALLYTVRTSPSLLHLSYNTFYYTFHHVRPMLGIRVYHFEMIEARARPRRAQLSGYQPSDHVGSSSRRDIQCFNISGVLSSLWGYSFPASSPRYIPFQLIPPPMALGQVLPATLDKR